MLNREDFMGGPKAEAINKDEKTVKSGSKRGRELRPDEEGHR